ncbi:hypothetical protein AAFF_G00203580 [Aldrovandia affinis]|uniref:Uncharacterized protein n=1 Tax=Aldrovandia affinis TaxID=143900 RepID=A0AAD7SY99_9TELE|nr:hypothetical protein AAFF_G00203580 [Aldrovandia affinis]
MRWHERRGHSTVPVHDVTSFGGGGGIRPRGMVSSLLGLSSLHCHGALPRPGRRPRRSRWPDVSRIYVPAASDKGDRCPGGRWAPHCGTQ